MDIDPALEKIKLLTLYLREASMLQPTFKVSATSSSIFGILLNLEEDLSGRSGAIKKIFLQPIDAELPTLSNSQKCEVEFALSSSGYVKFTASLRLLDGLVPLIELTDIENPEFEEQRRSKRTKIENAKKTFVVIGSSEKLEICSFKLSDLSPSTFAGTLWTTNQLDPETKYSISGKINLGSHFIVAKNLELLRIKKIKGTKTTGISEYEIAISGESHRDTDEKPLERRLSKRKIFNGSANIELRSNLFGNEIFNAEIIDLSGVGFSAQIKSHSNRLLILPGLEIQSAFSNLKGTVIEANGLVFRVKWTFDDVRDKVAWSKYIISLLNEDIIVGSYENESVLTLLARSGLKNTSYLKNYHLLTSMVSELNDVDSKGEIVSYKWISKGPEQKILAHVGAFKVADNLWFMGDLFASLETEKGETKTFVRDYLSGFIDFAQYTSPYLKIVTAWTPKHKYWKTLEENLIKSENKNIIFADSLGITFTPNITDHYPISKKIKSEEIFAHTLDKITRIRNTTETLGITGFLDAFDFTADRFSSPYLRVLLRSQGYKFLRKYYLTQIENENYLVIISNLPEGLSPQRHQSAVWIVSLNQNHSLTNITEVVKHATTKATEQSTFPSIIRLIGQNLEEVYFDRLSRFVIASPQIWGLT